MIVPSFTFAATANAVALTGATPVFADIDLGSFGLDVASVKEVLTDKTVGVMPVHLYGHPADVDGLGALCEQRGLALFEDAAQAHGAAWKGRPVGCFGAMAMFSLYPTKNMTSGEGGMVAVSDSGALRSMRLLRNQGMLRRYENEVVGFNARMTDLHAAIGRVQLAKLPRWNEMRRANAAFLSQIYEVSPFPRSRTARPTSSTSTRSSLTAKRQSAIGWLEHWPRNTSVGTGVFYPTPLHDLPSLRRYEPRTDMARTLRAAAQCLSLPVHPGLSSEDLENVVIATNAVVRAGG